MHRLLALAVMAGATACAHSEIAVRGDLEMRDGGRWIVRECGSERSYDLNLASTQFHRHAQELDALRGGDPNAPVLVEAKVEPLFGLPWREHRDVTVREMSLAPGRCGDHGSSR